MKNYTKFLRHRSLIYNIVFVIISGSILYTSLELCRIYNFLNLSEAENIVVTWFFVTWLIIFRSKMKLTSYVFVSLIAILVFYLNEIPYLWIPLILFILGFLYDFLNSLNSLSYIFKKRNHANTLGKSAILLDFIVTSFGILSMIGQFFLIIFLIYWWLF